jgi:hypothetical protein
MRERHLELAVLRDESRNEPRNFLWVANWARARSRVRAAAAELAEAIRRNPSLSKQRVIELSGIRHGRARALLDCFNNQLWPLATLSVIFR